MKELEALLGAAEIPCRVETRDRLAILVPAGGVILEASQRARIAGIARAAGFSHVAVEIDPRDASLPGD